MGTQLHARYPEVIVENVYGVWRSNKKEWTEQMGSMNEREILKVEQHGRLTSRIIHRTRCNDIGRRYGVRYRSRRLYSNSQNPFKNRCDNSEEAVDLKEAMRTISPRRCFPTLFVSTTHNMYNAALEWRWLRLVKWRFYSTFFNEYRRFKTSGKGKMTIANSR